MTVPAKTRDFGFGWPMLPDDEQRIEYRKKGDPRWLPGIVDFVFAAEDEPCIKLREGPYLFPTLGDDWR